MATETSQPRAYGSGVQEFRLQSLSLQFFPPIRTVLKRDYHRGVVYSLLRTVRLRGNIPSSGCGAHRLDLHDHGPWAPRRAEERQEDTTWAGPKGLGLNLNPEPSKTLNPKP